jgi:arylsulfatase A-like enzyme
MHIWHDYEMLIAEPGVVYRGERELRTSKISIAARGWQVRATACIGSILFALLFAGCSRTDSDPTPAQDRSPAESIAVEIGNQARHNVVVIVIDTLRPDHLGFNGHHRETAPYLASLAAKSAVFSEAVSTSTWTAPSTASLFTGLHPLRHGVQLGVVAHHKRVEKSKTDGVVKLEINRMPPKVSTMPELFRDLGYRTFGIAANPNIGSSIGFDRGFDRFELLESRPLSAEQARKLGRPEKPFRWANGEELHRELVTWKADIQAGEAPYFLYIHINDVHDPYEKHARFYREANGEDYGRALYDSGIGYVDDILAGVHRDFEFDRDTIIAVVSDHGEAFGEHGYFAHRQGVYAETNRILWMLSAPALGVEASRVQQRVSIMSVLPTLLELVGAEIPGGRDGLSLAPLLRPGREGDETARGVLERRFEERVLVVNRVAQSPDLPVSWAVMKGSWKLIHDGSRVELYDLRKDPAERNDLIEEYPAQARELAEELKAYRERTVAIESEKVEVLLDPQTVEALRELGYGD